MKRNGVTLVALVITITVSLILTAAVVMKGSDVPVTAELATFFNDVQVLQETVNTQLMTNKYKNPSDPNSENNKWIGVITEDNFVNGAPVFDIPLSVGETSVNVAPLSNLLLDYVSMSSSYLEQFFVDAQGTIYHQGKTIGGVTYYNKDLYTGSPVEQNPGVTRYIVVLNTNGGTINAGNVTRYTPGSEVALPTNVTKLGYIFEGWFDNSSFTGNAVTNINPEDSGNKTYYAKWGVDPSVIISVVSLVTNGGTINAGNVTSYVEGQGAVLPTNVTKTGFVFSGWYLASTLTGNAQTVIPVNATGTQIFYAKWIENSSGDTPGGGGSIVTPPVDPTPTVSSVALYTNGGTINLGAITSYVHGVGATLPTNITRGGYNFAGWYTTSNFLGNPATAISATDTGTKTFYAKWNEIGGSSTPSISYRVTLNTNGGIIMNGDVTSYTTGTATALPTNVVREGYVVSGDGNTITISSTEGLAWFASCVNGTITEGNLPNDISFTGKTFKLNADIVMNNDTIYYTQDEDRNWHLNMRDNALVKTWTPIGKVNYTFKGTFDGQGHSISGMYIYNTTADYQGFFGLVVDATLKNVNIENSYVYFRDYSGLLVGQANNTEISGINVINNIVRGRSQVGGIIGRAEVNGTEVTNLRNVNNIDTVISSGSENCGGIVGWNVGGTINNAINTGLVHITSNNVGGISGYNTANTKINKCYNYSDVYGVAQVGGILGNTITTDQVKCNNYGKITATGNYAGGINGSSESTTKISFCNNYNDIIGVSYIGGITGDTTTSCVVTSCNNYNSVNGVTYVGGIVGNNYNYSTVQDCINDAPITGTGNSVGGIVGYSDYIVVVDNCTNTENGDVTGTSYYIGGIVGYNNRSSIVRGCDNHSNIIGESEVGGVVGYNYSSAVTYNSYSIGNIKMTRATGGTAGLIVGYNYAYLYNCYGEGTVTGNGGSIGGVTGYNNSPIYNCYAKSSIIGNNNVGVISGYSDGANIKYCYGETDIEVLKSGGNSDMSLCRTFTLSDTTGTLNSSITVNTVSTSDLLTALNLWADSNTINPPYYEWVEDTENVHNGYPIFAQ